MARRCLVTLALLQLLTRMLLSWRSFVGETTADPQLSLDSKVRPHQLDSNVAKKIRARRNENESLRDAFSRSTQTCVCNHPRCQPCLSSKLNNDSAEPPSLCQLLCELKKHLRLKSDGRALRHRRHEEAAQVLLDEGSEAFIAKLEKEASSIRHRSAECVPAGQIHTAGIAVVEWIPKRSQTECRNPGLSRWTSTRGISASHFMRFGRHDMNQWTSRSCTCLKK